MRGARGTRLSLAVALVTCANAQAGDDSEMQEALAEAYWRNGNRDGAIQATEKALSLIEQKPTRAREHLEKTLAVYRTGKLPAAGR
jgi:Flp pilus assembly protein TadD